MCVCVCNMCLHVHVWVLSAVHRIYLKIITPICSASCVCVCVCVCACVCMYVCVCVLVWGGVGEGGRKGEADV